MKKICFSALMIIAFTALMISCNSTTPAEDGDTWQRMFGGSDKDYGQFVMQTNDGGYVVAGQANSGNISGFTDLDEGFYIIKLDSKGNTVWQKMFDMMFYSAAIIQMTDDNGFIVAGSADANVNGVTNYGKFDYYIVKLDADGNVIWQNTYGGSDYDHFGSIQQTADGGFIVAGYSESTDINGATNNGKRDMYIIKLDTNGDVLWHNMYGGADNDSAVYILQTDDGGFIVAGSTETSDIIGSNWILNIYIIKMNNDGTIAWRQDMYSDHSFFTIESVLLTSDGGCVVLANTFNNGLLGLASHGDDDILLIKLNGNGSIAWQQLYGGLYREDPISLLKTSDGGYIILATSISSDIPGTLQHGGRDHYIVKVDSEGGIMWQKMFGGPYDDDVSSISQTSDGGYLVTGGIVTDDPDDNRNMDCYIYKLSGDGSLMWEKTYGGNYTNYEWHWVDLYESDGPVPHLPYGYYVYERDPGRDTANTVLQTSDGGYIVVGSSTSGDISGLTNHGEDDFYVLKLDANADL